jgi:hypothetical protein
MLTEPVDVEPRRFGHLDLFYYLTQSLGVAGRVVATVGADGLGKAGDS